ncbi:hypothetical protein ACQEU3_42360 [Spirillospora sp. CA-253888]
MEALNLFGQTTILLTSVISYPALLAAGLSPLSANVTNTAALTFKAVGAGWGARGELAGQGRRIVRLGALTALGGAAAGPRASDCSASRSTPDTAERPAGSAWPPTWRSTATTCDRRPGGAAGR